MSLMQCNMTSMVTHNSASSRNAYGYQRCKARSVIASAVAPAAPTLVPRKVPEHLKGPSVVKMKGVLRKEAPVVRTCDPGCELGVYMQSFASNFSAIELPLGGGMVRKSDHRFEIGIPRFQLFDIAIQPQVQCDVKTTPGMVFVTSKECTITGSPHVAQYRLNEKFDLYVDVTFSWINADKATGSAPKIVVASDLLVLVDLPPPFNMVPRMIVESTCNAAMSQSLNLLLNSFVESLTADYAIWSKDASVRSQGLRTLRLNPNHA